MNKGNKKQIFEGIGVNGFIIIITAITTIATSVAIGFISPTNGEDGTASLMYTIIDRGFYISLSSLIVEVLYNVFKLQLSTEEVANNIHKKDVIIFPRENAKLEISLENGLNNPKVKKAQIICYGTSKFARVIEYLGRDFTHIQTEVIVFSPEVTILGFNKDKERLKNVISSMASSNNITVYLCGILPTIRGAAFLNKSDQPLFCLMQPYLINPDDNSSVLVMGKGVTPAMVAEDESSPILMELSNCFLVEFERLKKHSIEYSDYIEKL